VDRQVDAEPDLDKRVNILKEALDLHPDETHFERALRLVKDKRDLVNSIVARAHHHEQEGAFSDALNDWEILRTIYSQYPGLKFEVERLQKRREQQSRSAAKTKLVEQIDACLHSSDYSRALGLLQQATAEFPNDAELAPLEKLANDGLQRATEAHRLMTEGQDLCAQDRFADGIKLLKEAYELDEHNALTRAVFSNALVEQARLVAETNWQEADQLARQAFELNPSHPLSKTVRTLILDRSGNKRSPNTSRRPASCRQAAIWPERCLGLKRRWRRIRARFGSFKFRKRCSGNFNPNDGRRGAATWKNCDGWTAKLRPSRIPP
jgi:tetratricopeptide (TPR) repeat protein